jgi:hypothetical protein
MGRGIDIFDPESIPSKLQSTALDGPMLRAVQCGDLGAALDG